MKEVRWFIVWHNEINVTPF